MNPRIPLNAALVAAALVGALATSATAKPDAAGQRQCFWARDVNGFTAIDEKTVNIRVGAKDIYQLSLFSPSPDINWSEHIGLKSRGSSWICSGLDATIIVPSPIGPRRYPVTSIRKLTPAEVAALSPKARP